MGRKGKSNETLQIILIMVVLVVLIALTVWLMLKFIGIEPGTLSRGAILGAVCGLVGAILNGPDARNPRENPTWWKVFGDIVRLGWWFIPGAAAFGAILGISYGASDAAPVAGRVVIGAVVGGILGAPGSILTVQVVLALVSAFGALLFKQRRRRLLVEMADGAQGSLYEGFIVFIIPGVVVGAVVGAIRGWVGP